MNNLQLIEKTLYYIDEHICEELTYPTKINLRLIPRVSASTSM